MNQATNSSSDVPHIRRALPEDTDRIADIWLTVNLEAHSFIPAAYWQAHFEEVRSQLSETEVYVCETRGALTGFIGLYEDYIAGIFVTADAQSQGFGKALLDYVKSIKPQLSLHVYEKNSRAVKFYQREGFKIIQKSTDDNTGEAEYSMHWQG